MHQTPFFKEEVSMKKISKFLVIASALIVMGAVPAMAQEVTDPATIKTEADLLKELAAHQATVEGQVNVLIASMADKNAASQHAATVAAQIAKYNRDEADNYLDYLRRAIINLKETERIKKEVVDNYTVLGKTDPTFAAKLPQAINDYNAAVAARTQWEANLAKAAADFAVMFPR